MNKRRPPAHLSASSRALFAKILEEYDIDRPAEMILVATLEARDRREQARVEIAKHGAVFVDRFEQQKPSPWTAIERDAATTMMRGFRLLGFDQAPRGESPLT